MKTAKELPPLDTLRETFTYEPETGLLRWKTKSANRIEIGSIAGSKNRRGYIVVGMKGKVYLAHRICWALYHNEQLSPDVEIDHIYGIRDDNRITELRKATRNEQGYNGKLRSTNTSGHRGVIYYKARQKWVASITVGGRSIHLGYFEEIEDAIAARLKAEQENNIFVKVR